MIKNLLSDIFAFLFVGLYLYIDYKIFKKQCKFLVTLDTTAYKIFYSILFASVQSAIFVFFSQFFLKIVYPVLK